MNIENKLSKLLETNSSDRHLLVIELAKTLES